MLCFDFEGSLVCASDTSVRNEMCAFWGRKAGFCTCLFTLSVQSIINALVVSYHF